MVIAVCDILLPFDTVFYIYLPLVMLHVRDTMTHHTVTNQTRVLVRLHQYPANKKHISHCNQSDPCTGTPTSISWQRETHITL